VNTFVPVTSKNSASARCEHDNSVPTIFVPVNCNRKVVEHEIKYFEMNSQLGRTSFTIVRKFCTIFKAVATSKNY
jgi:hypothetical protein